MRGQLVLRANAAGSEVNVPFSDGERLQVVERLQAMEGELRAQGKLTEGIKTALDEAKDAGSRMGRKDWMNWFIGTITKLVIAGSIDREVGTTSWSSSCTGWRTCSAMATPPPITGG